MRIRILSYNIHKGIGGVDRRYDLGRIVDTIAHYDPDFVLLQEVARNTPRSNHDDQVRRLAERLGMRHHEYYTNVKKRRLEYGNAILAKFPLTDATNIDITIPPKKRRSVLHARTRVRLRSRHSRTLHLFNLHLGLSGAERKMQLRRFIDSHPFARLDHRTPLVVAGDFNDLYATLGPKILEPAGFRGLARASRTFPAYAPLRALDAIYVRGHIRILHAHASRLQLARQASDHLPLVADLEITSGR